MTVDVLYVTYAKDADWFRWSIAVLEHNLKGYRNIIVVCPEQDVKKISGKLNAHTLDTKIIGIPDWPGQGYYWQQWVKMHADQYSDADLILHIDSDAFFKGPVDVQDFFVDGKPAWLWAWYTDLGDTVPWQEPTERATGLVCEREFMQGFPFIIDRRTYSMVQSAFNADLAGVPLTHYIRASATAGRKFSEFNVLGRLAWEHQSELYAWVDRNRDEWPKGFHQSRQFWSHAPLKDHLTEINKMLGLESAEQSIRTTDMGIWVLSNDTHISMWVEKQRRLDFDQHFIPQVTRYINPGDTVVDVGAFIGDHTWAYAKAVLGKDTGRVLAFEPNAMPFECLRRNMRGHGHVECINKGLANVDGHMGFARDANVGASYLVPGTGVEVTTLDSYGLHFCHLIKVDAEGFEFAILQGAHQTIARCRPVIVLEINEGALARNGVLPEDIFGWLRLRGYQVNGYVAGAPQYDVICLPQ